MKMLTRVVVERVLRAEGPALASELHRTVAALAPAGTDCRAVRWEEGTSRIVVELVRSVTLRRGFTTDEYRATVGQPALDLVHRSVAQTAVDPTGLEIRVLRNSLLIEPRVRFPKASGKTRRPRTATWYRIVLEIDHLGAVPLASVAREFAAALREREHLRGGEAFEVPERGAIAMIWEAEAFDETDAAENALSLAEELSYFVVPDADDMKLRVADLSPVTERRAP